VSGPAPDWTGHPGRNCGEHRTVGPHRAWCHDCREWCYPDVPCAHCELPLLRTALAAVLLRSGQAPRIEADWVEQARGLYVTVRRAAGGLMFTLTEQVPE
jgi:hypothetical protein